ncbi:unnamed protein product [Schistosoma curassoni]|uniref:ANTH domain-containing protein n=1 Tax=Schistosoma curassoni TaxID=6186 RepID=A0A183JKU3_9TREM|nr:unnamed protein product [Schistosoma curassoni]
MKILPVIEKQLDALLMFDATLNELSNSLLRVAHLSLYRDLIRLYAVYNEGMINLIGPKGSSIPAYMARLSSYDIYAENSE